MDHIPPPVLYTVIASLAGAICYLFKIVLSHHADSVKEWRNERMNMLAAINGLQAALERMARIELMRFCASPNVSNEIKASAQAMLSEIPEPK